MSPSPGNGARAETVPLFTPGRIGSIELRNRIVMAPLTTSYAHPDGAVSERLLAYYRTRAAGGTAAIIVEGALVDPRGQGWLNHLAAWDDRFVPGLSRLAETIHTAGAVPILQLIHCGRQTSRSLLGQMPVAPSPIPCPRVKEPVEGLSTEATEAVVAAFAASARRARAAGFAAVELHAAHGYLLAGFLSPYANVRTDRYGRDRDGRFRIIEEILAGIRGACGAGYPVLCRISADEFVEGGVDVDLSRHYARRLEAEGVAAIHCSAGTGESNARLPLPAGCGEATISYLAAAIRKEVTIPVIAVGRIVTPSAAARIVASGTADFVALGRALVADPDWTSKARDGHDEAIVPCHGCNVCQLRSGRAGVICLANPRAGREDELDERPAARPKAVLVHGASLPGLEAATVLARRGHRVTILCPERELGGLFRLRSRVPGLEDFAETVRHYENRLQALGVEVRVGAGLPANSQAEPRSDALLIARAYAPIPPRSALDLGVDCLSALDVLGGAAVNGSRVLVIGGRAQACEVAIFLAGNGREVLVAAEQPDLALDTQPQCRYRLLLRMQELGIRAARSTRVERLRPLTLAGHEAAAARGFGEPETIVYATETEGFPAAELESVCGRFPNVVVVGDAYSETLLAQQVYAAGMIAREM